MKKINFDQHDPHLSLLCKEDVAKVIHEANSACLGMKSVAEIEKIAEQASQHNTETGFIMNTALSLACRIELKIRSHALEPNRA